MTEWTEADLATLREMADKGASLNRAAARLNRSATAVRKRAKDMGLSFKDAASVRKDGGLREQWVQNRGD